MTRVSKADNIDWDFRDVITAPAIHRFHWFQARFMPQIPNILINTLTEEGDGILDPFCGCGTTLVESLKNGRRSVGVDFHPLAHLISKVKTTLLEPEHLNNENITLVEVLNKKIRKKEVGVPSFDELTKKDLKVNVGKVPTEITQNFEEIQKWYHPDSLKELIIIYDFLLEIGKKDEDLMDFYKICFSNILKKSSSQTEHMGYVADNMIPKNKIYRPAWDYFKNHLDFMEKGMSEFYRTIQDLSMDIETLNDLTQVFKGDSRELNTVIGKQEPINLIVTSPPYPNVADYSTMHRLSFYWNNWDLQEHKKIEIGARWKRGRKNALVDYYENIKRCANEMIEVLETRGYLAIVLGNPTRNKIREDVTKKIHHILVDDFDLIFRKKFDRKVSFQRIPTKQVSEETIFIYEKY